MNHATKTAVKKANRATADAKRATAYAAESAEYVESIVRVEAEACDVYRMIRDEAEAEAEAAGQSTARYRELFSGVCDAESDRTHARCDLNSAIEAAWQAGQQSKALRGIAKRLRHDARRSISADADTIRERIADCHVVVPTRKPRPILAELRILAALWSLVTSARRHVAKRVEFAAAAAAEAAK